MSEVINYYDNIADRTIALLLQQFKTKEAFIAFVEVLTEEFQALEQVFKDINDLTWLDTSEGIQLDRNADIVGYSRDSRTDAEFREFLNFGIALNRSAGEPEFLISALLLFTKATRVNLFEFFPAACAAHTNGQLIPANITAQMDDLAMGGVAFLYVSQTDGIPFGFDPESAETGLLGFAWINGSSQLEPDDAGEFAQALPT